MVTPRIRAYARLMAYETIIVDVRLNGTLCKTKISKLNAMEVVKKAIA